MAKQDPRVAKRYAEALLKVAVTNDVVRPVEDDLNGVQNLLTKDDKFRDFLISPFVARDEKIKIAERLFSDRVTALTMQALRLMLQKRREAEIPGLREEYITLRRAHENVEFASVTSAEEMTGEQKEKALRKLHEMTGKTIEAEFLVDKSVIGGAKVA